MKMENYDYEIDLTGLFCPIPIIKVSEKLKEIESGKILKILADDIGVKQDIPAFCKTTGNEFIKFEENNNIITLYIRKK